MILSSLYYYLLEDFKKLKAFADPVILKDNGKHDSYFVSPTYSKVKKSLHYLIYLITERNRDS